MEDKKQTIYSPEILCQQMHSLYNLLKKRKEEILADPAFDEGNDALNDELVTVHNKLELLHECFENFCPS